MTIHTHTPTPYTIELDTNPITIVDGNGEVVAYCGHSDIPANQRKADFIVRACNAHDALVTALESLMRCSDDSSERWDSYRQAKSALKLARGE